MEHVEGNKRLPGIEHATRCPHCSGHPRFEYSSRQVFHSYMAC